MERMSLFLGTDSKLVARMSEQVFHNGVSDPGYAKLVVSAPLVRPAPTRIAPQTLRSPEVCCSVYLERCQPRQGSTWEMVRDSSGLSGVW